MIKIPDKLHPKLIEWLGDGLSSREIAAKLNAEYKIDVSYVTVTRVCKGLRKERAEAAKAVVRSEIAGTLTTDLRRLERLEKRLLNAIAKRPEDELQVKQIEQVRKLIETKLKYSGADETDERTATPIIMLPPEADD